MQPMIVKADLKIIRKTFTSDVTTKTINWERIFPAYQTSKAFQLELP
jgi:hypothetical protein